MPAGVYRHGKAAYMRQYRASHKAKGLCVLCSDTAHGGTTRCFKHRLYNSAWQRAARQRKAA